LRRDGFLGDFHNPTEGLADGQGPVGSLINVKNFAFPADSNMQ
jgi:hypothetical protein